MAVKDLHEAAKVLQGAYQAIERLLDETEPLEREYLRRWAQLHDAGASDEVVVKLGDDLGWRAFHDAADNLVALCGIVDRFTTDEQCAHWKRTGAA